MEAPPIITAARPRFPWLLAAGIALVAIAAGTVLFLFNPSQYGFYPRCALYTMTGLQCPGCGTQRAVYNLLHGHLAAALRCNAVFVLGLPAAAFVLTRFTARWMMTGVMPSINIHVRWIKVGVAVIIVFTILRNIPCAPFNYLAPLP